MIERVYKKGRKKEKKKRVKEKNIYILDKRFSLGILSGDMNTGSLATFIFNACTPLIINGEIKSQVLMEGQRKLQGYALKVGPVCYCRGGHSYASKAQPVYSTYNRW